jgi:hypothetical protein
VFSVGCSPRVVSKVLRCRCHCFFRHGEQLAFDEPTDCDLRGTLRNANRFGKFLIADSHSNASPTLLNVEPQVDHETDRSPVVANEISHENIGDVIVYQCHCYTGKQYSSDYLIECFPWRQ